MGRSAHQSLQLQRDLARLLALNSLFDAACAGGERGREAAATVQRASHSLSDAACVDPNEDADLLRCYSALLEASEPPARLS